MGLANRKISLDGALDVEWHFRVRIAFILQGLRQWVRFPVAASNSARRVARGRVIRGYIFGRRLTSRGSHRPARVPTRRPPTACRNATTCRSHDAPSPVARVIRNASRICFAPAVLTGRGERFRTRAARAITYRTRSYAGR